MEFEEIRAMLMGPKDNWVKDKHWIWTGACTYSPDRPRFQSSHGSVRVPKTSMPIVGRNGTTVPARNLMIELLKIDKPSNVRVIVACEEPKCMNPTHWTVREKPGTEAGGIAAIVAEIEKLNPAPQSMNNLLSRVTCFAADEVRLAAKHMGLAFA